MWLRRDESAWVNPCGAIRLREDVRGQYQDVFEDLQRQWYALWPGVEADPKWYACRNPQTALGYPPGFLRRDLDVVVIYTATSPDTDGYFWANRRVIVDIDSYEKLALALFAVEEPVDMLILSGECLQVPGDACGVCWRELN